MAKSSTAQVLAAMREVSKLDRRGKLAILAELEAQVKVTEKVEQAKPVTYKKDGEA